MIFAQKSEWTLVAVDPYLSNSCVTLNTVYGLDFSRVSLVFIGPEDLWVDLVLLTHSHLDHLDRETIRRFTRKDEARFFVPWQAWRLLPDLGIDPGHAFLIHPLQALEFRDLKVTGTWSVPTDATDLNHLGFAVEFANGIKYYNTGDTAFRELLGHVRKLEPHVMSICINGGFNNLSPWDAARVIKFVQPGVVIPAHHDMMVCNQQDPVMFENSLKAQGVTAKYTRMGYYEPYLYTP